MQRATSHRAPLSDCALLSNRQTTCAPALLLITRARRFRTLSRLLTRLRRTRYAPLFSRSPNEVYIEYGHAALYRGWCAFFRTNIAALTYVLIAHAQQLSLVISHTLFTSAGALTNLPSLSRASTSTANAYQTLTWMGNPSQGSTTLVARQCSERERSRVQS